MNFENAEVLRNAQPSGLNRISGAEDDLPGVSARLYILVLLTVTLTLATLDRQLLMIMVEPIRAEFGLSDTEIGFLTGLAFSIPYMAAIIPLARIADRRSRRQVLAVALAFWSLATILCGFVQNFIQLLLARGAVGLGESGHATTGSAMVSDIIPPKWRGAAFSLYWSGNAIGMGLGLTLGGLALHAYGWRAIFPIAGAAGIFVAILYLATTREVRKGAADGVKHDLPQLPLGETLWSLWSIRTLPLITVGSSILGLLVMGLSAWTPAFLMRSHGLSALEVGTKLGFAMSVGSLIGHLSGGPLADLLARKNRNILAWIPVVTTVVSTGLGVTAYLGPVDLFFPLIGLQIMVSGLFTAPLSVIKMTLSPVAARATMMSISLFLVNLVSLGAGPFLVGVLSDLLRPAYGEEALHIALLATFSLAFPALALFLIATRYFGSDWDQSMLRAQGRLDH